MFREDGRAQKSKKRLAKTVPKRRNHSPGNLACNEIGYPIGEARQRFYLWAACRAAQAGRSKGKRQELIAALQKCGVVEFVERNLRRTNDGNDFEKLFSSWVDNVKRRLRIRYGVAAKLVSVYLKGAFILSGGEKSKLAKRIWPPIDSLLLAGIDKHCGTRLSKTPDYKWTKLKPRAHKELIRKLRGLNGRRPLWHIERFWDPAAD